MANHRAQARERKRKQRALRAARLRPLRIYVDDDVADEVTEKKLLDQYDVRKLISAVLAALCVTRDPVRLRDALVSALKRYLSQERQRP